jgi:hypothetical protein
VDSGSLFRQDFRKGAHVPDAATQAQTFAAIEQAHAAWAQVAIGAVSAFATFLAVITALGVPLVQWWRQKTFSETTLVQAARAIISLHETLETKLLTFNPAGGLSVVRIARKRVEYTIPTVREYRMITCLLALTPILSQAEKELERWTEHLHGGGNFSPDNFRAGMLLQAQKAAAILQGYGSQGLKRKLEQTAGPFP